MGAGREIARMARAPSLLESIGRAREYTNYLLSGTDPDDWFRMPHEGVSHIAWQVGHLAFAEYSLALKRKARRGSATASSGVCRKVRPSLVAGPRSARLSFNGRNPPRL